MVEREVQKEELKEDHSFLDLLLRMENGGLSSPWSEAAIMFSTVHQVKAGSGGRPSALPAPARSHKDDFPARRAWSSTTWR